MAPFEYLLLFASVIMGLAACEIAIGLNRLLGAWERVDWEWLAPLAALLTFLKLVTQWWAWHGAVGLAAGLTFEMYLAVLAGAVLLFMMAAAALPAGPATSEARIDLRGHYARVERRYWILFTLHFLLASATSIWLQMAIGHARFVFSPLYLIGLVGIVSILVCNRIWQTIALGGLCLFYFFQSFGQLLPG
jgi:hypothetical protein